MGVKLAFIPMRIGMHAQMQMIYMECITFIRMHILTPLHIHSHSGATTYIDKYILKVLLELDWNALVTTPLIVQCLPHQHLKVYLKDTIPLRYIKDTNKKGLIDARF